MKIAWIGLPTGSHVYVRLPRAHGLIRINLSITRNMQGMFGASESEMTLYSE